MAEENEIIGSASEFIKGEFQSFTMLGLLLGENENKS